MSINFQALNRHKIEFSLNQIKDHLMNTVEATCRGDPGAVFLSSSVRQPIFATQVCRIYFHDIATWVILQNKYLNKPSKRP